MIDKQITQVQEIIDNFEKSKLTFLELEIKDIKIKLSKNKNFENSVNFSKEIIDTSKNEQFLQKNEIENEARVQSVQAKNVEVKSLLVGTFYAGNCPDAESFVKVNQKVTKGQTLCIIEAMKIMNEIVSPVDGIIASIKINNGEPVGFEQVLMTIEKCDDYAK